MLTLFFPSIKFWLFTKYRSEYNYAYTVVQFWLLIQAMGLSFFFVKANFAPTLVQAGCPCPQLPVFV